MITVTSPGKEWSEITGLHLQRFAWLLWYLTLYSRESLLSSTGITTVRLLTTSPPCHLIILQPPFHRAAHQSLATRRVGLLSFSSAVTRLQTLLEKTCQYSESATTRNRFLAIAWFSLLLLYRSCLFTSSHVIGNCKLIGWLILQLVCSDWSMATDCALPWCYWPQDKWERSKKRAWRPVSAICFYKSEFFSAWEFLCFSWITCSK